MDDLDEIPVEVGEVVVGMRAHRISSVAYGHHLAADDERVLVAFAAQLANALAGLRLRRAVANAEALERANELRTSLLAAVSHDLRTTALVHQGVGHERLRADDVPWSPEDAAAFLATIEEETDRLNGLVGNLLDMSRIQTGALRSRRQPWVRRSHARQAASRSHAARRRDHGHLPAAGGGVTRILVVDDEPQIRRALATNLQARGYETDLAEDGETARDLAARHHPDAVVLDLGLPGITGIQVIEGLRGWSTVPIIVLSVRDAESDKVLALDAGADDYVTKPFGMDELLAPARRGAPRRADARGRHGRHP